MDLRFMGYLNNEQMVNKLKKIVNFFVKCAFTSWLSISSRVSTVPILRKKA